MKRLLLALGLALLFVPSVATSDDDIDLDAAGSAPEPTLRDFGYFFSNLSERDQGRALNVVTDLAADSRLDRKATAEVLRKLLDEGPPPEEFGYRCPNCFQKRLSNLLAELRLKGPRVAPPRTGLILIPVDDRLVRRLRPDAREAFGGDLQGLVKALVGGYSIQDKFISDSYARYHSRGVETDKEPSFFLSADDLAAHEKQSSRQLDSYGLAKWSCQRTPGRFDPGFVVLEFDPAQACIEVRIPTAADTEHPDFRPSPASEKESGFTCGGAREWVCPNIPMSAMTGSRFVANLDYVAGIPKD
jgi:hypothetical protein